MCKRLLLILLVVPLPLFGIQVLVNDSGDESAFNPTVSAEVGYRGSGLVTLRSAIECINTKQDGANSISFATGLNPFVIQVPSTPLPNIVVPVAIRGSSAKKLKASSNLQVVLEGPGAAVPTVTSGLTFDSGSDGSIVEGLCITGFIGDGLTQFGAAITILSDECQIRGNYLGLDSSGTTVMPNLSGIVLHGNNARIEKNVIAGNLLGISCFYSGANFEGNELLPYPIGAIFISGSSNRVENNFIGTAADGENPLQNDVAIRICGNDNSIVSNVLNATIAAVQIIGLPNTYFGKVLPKMLSKNIEAGRGNRILANSIGTNASQTKIFESPGIGVHFAYGPLDGITPQNNLVSQNRISGFSKGIQLGACNTPVLNNQITQNVITYNSLYGIFATNASYTTIKENVVSANGSFGIYLTDQVMGNSIVNNLIGTDETGLKPLGNGLDGIRIQTPYFCNWWMLPVQQNSSTTVSGNIISANGQSGICLAANTTNNIIQDNWIGLSADLSPLGNGQDGITVLASSNNLIGGAPLSGTQLLSNSIAYNQGLGVNIDPDTTNNAVLNNTIWDNGVP